MDSTRAASSISSSKKNEDMRRVPVISKGSSYGQTLYGSANAQGGWEGELQLSHLWAPIPNVKRTALKKIRERLGRGDTVYFRVKDREVILRRSTTWSGPAHRPEILWTRISARIADTIEESRLQEASIVSRNRRCQRQWSIGALPDLARRG